MESTLNIAVCCSGRKQLVAFYKMTLKKFKRTKIKKFCANKFSAFRPAL